MRLTLVISLIFTAFSVFSQNADSKAAKQPPVNTTEAMKRDTVSPKDSIKYVPVFLTPSGTRLDTVATIEFAYVGYNYQLFYTDGFVIQESKLFTAPNGEVLAQAGDQYIMNRMSKRFYVDKKDVKGNLATCGCYIYNYKQPVPVEPKKK